MFSFTPSTNSTRYITGWKYWQREIRNERNPEICSSVGMNICKFDMEIGFSFLSFLLHLINFPNACPSRGMTASVRLHWDYSTNTKIQGTPLLSQMFTFTSSLSQQTRITCRCRWYKQAGGEASRAFKTSSCILRKILKCGVRKHFIFDVGFNERRVWAWREKFTVELALYGHSISEN